MNSILKDFVTIILNVVVIYIGYRTMTDVWGLVVKDWFLFWLYLGLIGIVGGTVKVLTGAVKFNVDGSRVNMTFDIHGVTVGFRESSPGELTVKNPSRFPSEKIDSIIKYCIDEGFFPNGNYKVLVCTQ